MIPSTDTRRSSPLEIEPQDFRDLGHRVVDRAAEFLATLRSRSVTKGEPPEVIRQLLGSAPMPEDGTDPGTLLDRAATLLVEHSLFNGHPKFWGYITSSAAPIGSLGDLLASTINPNVGAYNLSPVATEVELETIRWIAELLGYTAQCAGILVSGGNMANFVGFIVACHNQVPWDLRTDGWNGKPSVAVYASTETHGWLEKAADICGLGTKSIRWIDTDDQLRLRPDSLAKQIDEDKSEGVLPLMVIAAAGSVGTGAVDPLMRIAEICRQHKLWLHADGAYGGFAAMLPDAPGDLKALALADSVAVDPHKWLYAPLEAGCALVKDPALLKKTFSFHARYYRFDETGGEPPVNFLEHGPQNSRGFRALKVWLGLSQAGRKGYREMLETDVALAGELYRIASSHPELEPFSHNLSITTFRYVPKDMRDGKKESEEYLNRLNAELLDQLQLGGEAFLSNHVIQGKFVLRVCIVNFRTSHEDIQEIPEIVIRYGREVDTRLRKQETGP